jgi:hypothetical protein
MGVLFDITPTTFFEAMTKYEDYSVTAMYGKLRMTEAAKLFMQFQDMFSIACQTAKRFEYELAAKAFYHTLSLYLDIPNYLGITSRKWIAEHLSNYQILIDVANAFLYSHYYYCKHRETILPLSMMPLVDVVKYEHSVKAARKTAIFIAFYLK